MTKMAATLYGLHWSNIQVIPRLDITRPLISEVQQLWDGLQKEQDLLLQKYSLGFLVEQWGVSLLLFAGKVDGQLAALFIIRDPIFDEQGQPRYGWLTLYIVPRFRGKVGVQLCHAAVGYAQQQGFRFLYTAIHAAHRPSRVMARRAGFVRCGALPGAAPSAALGAGDTFAGNDVVFYMQTLEPIHEEVRVRAHERADLRQAG
jgi:hypothetical protein